jgi:hypothetical protein
MSLPQTPRAMRTGALHVKKARTATVLPKMRQLARIATDLREGASCNMPRLTTRKSLGEDSTTAARCALPRAPLPHKTMQEHRRPPHLNAQPWQYDTQGVAEARRQMPRYREEPHEAHADVVRAWLLDVRKLQDRDEPQAWGPVRLIDSPEVLRIEYALSCLLQPHASAEWGYRLARQYTERSHSRYGTGLIPASAPMVEDLADFWCPYHVGKPFQEWLNTASAS